MAIRVSPGSGATVATEIIGGANYQQIKVVDGTPGSTNTWTINPDGSGLFSTNNLTSLASGTIILASQNGTWNTNITGLVSLASGTEIRSLATILNFPANQNVNFNQLVSLASGTQILANQNGTWNVGLTGLVSLPSGTNVLTQEQNLISLASGTEVRSLATILNFPTTQAVNFNQLVSLASGTQILVNQNGVWNVGINGLISLASGTNILTSFSGVISLASGQEIKSLATINNFPTSYPVTNLISVASINGLLDAKQNGIWNINTSTASITGIVNLVGIGSVSNASLTTNFIDTITLGQYGGDTKGSLASGSYHPLQTDNFGNLKVQISNTLISLASGTNILVTQSGNWGVAASLPTTTVIGSLNSLASIYGIVGNAAGTNFIGLASVVPAYQPITSNYTSFATLISASGAASLFSPPNNQRFVIKDIIVGSLGFNEFNIQSGGSTVLIPFMALATQGGYVFNGGESGMRGKALNDAFIVNKNSTATLSIFVNVRFDPI